MIVSSKAQVLKSTWVVNKGHGNNPYKYLAFLHSFSNFDLWSDVIFQHWWGELWVHGAEPPHEFVAPGQDGREGRNYPDGGGGCWRGVPCHAHRRNWVGEKGSTWVGQKPRWRRPRRRGNRPNTHRSNGWKTKARPLNKAGFQKVNRFLSHCHIMYQWIQNGILKN